MWAQFYVNCEFVVDESDTENYVCKGGQLDKSCTCQSLSCVSELLKMLQFDSKNKKN